MQIVYVDCPKCRQEFHCDAYLLELAIPLHCPRCNLYFMPDRAQGRLRLSLTGLSGLGAAGPSAVYVPPSRRTNHDTETG
jgi:hypothetical protein